MTAVLPEVSPQSLYAVYAFVLLPILIVAGFEISERVVSRLEKRRSHTLMRPVILGICIIWVSLGLLVSGPIANHFNQSSFHSQLEDELEVKKLVSTDDTEIEACTRDLVDAKSFEVKWKEKREEFTGILILRPNGNDSCVYELTKSNNPDS